MDTKKICYSTFAISGLFGGLAEVVWMYAYSHNRTIGLQEIGKEIAATVHIISPNYYLGLTIHLILSALIGIAFGKFVLDKISKNKISITVISSLLMLASIWICTFKLILPLIDSNMMDIVPQPISFISKMLFGAFMATAYLFLTRKKGVL